MQTPPGQFRAGFRFFTRARLHAIRFEDRDVTTDDLGTPLDSGRNHRSGKRRSVSLLPLIAGALGAIILVGLLWIAFVDDPLGGEPVAVVAIEAPDARATPSDRPPETAGSPPQKPAEQSSRTVTIIDGKSGARTEVPVDDPQGSAKGPAELLDARIVESSPHGPIPRIGPDGLRALDVFAGARADAIDRDSPHIAIVIGGLGVGSATTQSAIASLPPAVTLAFAPYGPDLARSVGEARRGGHEILLQIPMEPFDYPDNDPGPRTLLTSVSLQENLDRLHWFLSRIQGYVGVSAFMGARFTAQEPALAPILADLAKRGLLYFDDGSSPRSLAQKAAQQAKVPFVAADIVVDAKPAWSEIDAALERLERVARERGFAVGGASALPVSIERIARWIKEAEARGIRVVPLSTIALRSRQS
jgi:hypothetical protein